tara:strand:+ start:186 stop:596 length:411 start_codon:yes stop_codon:yes gene_type:complete
MSGYDERTPAQKKTAARKHYLAALYHNVFMAPADRTIQPTVGVNVDAMTANRLVSNKLAMLQAFPQTDGSMKVVLSQTKTGSRLYDRNTHIYTKSPSAGIITLHRINKWSRDEQCNMSEVREACMRLSGNMFHRWF